MKKALLYSIMILCFGILIGINVYLQYSIKQEEKATAAEIERMLDLMEEACKQQKEMQSNQLTYEQDNI